MNIQALFCDGTGNYVIPPEPKKNEKILLRFRTAKDDVDHVFLLVGNQSYELEKKETKGIFDYYEIEWQLGEKEFHYAFQICGAGEVKYFNRCGVAGNREDFYAFMITPGFSTPGWAKGAVMYQIFVDRFYNGDQTNDVESGEYAYIGEHSVRVKDWSKYPAFMGVREFYGGDLKGVLEKIDYLQELGVEAVYFNPLFVSPSNHKYDIQDYDHIDPHYGVIVEDGGEVLADGCLDNSQASKYQIRTTDPKNLEASNAFFAELVAEFHKRGIKVIIDGVFNHCGSFNKWLDRERIYESQEGYGKGAYVAEDSPYHNFFRFFKEEWPYNRSYDGWWGHDTLPKLNYEGSEELQQYILEIAKKWVSPPYNVDGWRLDVAADLGYSNEFNHEFWKKFRIAVKEANPEALILAEHYGDPREWLQGDEWDTVMNYDAFMEPLTWFFTGMEKHSDERRQDLWGNADHFVSVMRHHMAAMQTPSLQVAMNELSNHDHSRFLTRTNHIVGRVQNLGYKAAKEGINPAVMRSAVVMQMTWVGAPTVYYGDEAGVCGFTDPDNRRTYPWGQEDQELLQFHKDMIRLHKEQSVLRCGSIKMLFWDENVLAYSRFSEEQQIVVIINNSKKLKEVTVPVWMAELPMRGKMDRLLYTYEQGYTMEPDYVLIDQGEVVLNMGRHSAIVLRSRKVPEKK